MIITAIDYFAEQKTVFIVTPRGMKREVVYTTKPNMFFCQNLKKQKLSLIKKFDRQAYDLVLFYQHNRTTIYPVCDVRSLKYERNKILLIFSILYSVPSFIYFSIAQNIIKKNENYKRRITFLSLSIIMYVTHLNKDIFKTKQNKKKVKGRCCSATA